MRPRNGKMQCAPAYKLLIESILVRDYAWSGCSSTSRFLTSIASLTRSTLYEEACTDGCRTETLDRKILLKTGGSARDQIRRIGYLP